jgi:hypothetical protein
MPQQLNPGGMKQFARRFIPQGFCYQYCIAPRFGADIASLCDFATDIASLRDLVRTLTSLCDLLSDKKSRRDIILVGKKKRRND